MVYLCPSNEIGHQPPIKIMDHQILDYEHMGILYMLRVQHSYIHINIISSDKLTRTFNTLFNHFLKKRAILYSTETQIKFLLQGLIWRSSLFYLLKYQQFCDNKNMYVFNIHSTLIYDQIRDLFGATIFPMMDKVIV